MAKDRTQVRALPGPVPITPRAAPVDTYHRPSLLPPPSGPSELDQLVGALSDIQPTINQFASIAHNKNVEQAMSEGEKAVLADKRLQNRKALREMVANGSLPAARNPWFLQGARQQVYRLQGETFDRALREKYAISDARNDEDIAGFVGTFTEDYMKLNDVDASDPEFAKILTPMIERSQANLFGHHRQERDRALEQQVIENTDREIGLLLDQSEELATVPEVAGPLIQNILDQQYKNGLSGTVTNEIAAKAIARKAELSLDPAYLDVLDNITTGSGTLGQIGWVKDLRADTEAKIYRATEENDRISSRVTKDENDALLKDIKSQISVALLKDPGADISELHLQLAEIDPDEAQKVSGWKQSAINNEENRYEDQEVAIRLKGKVLDGRGSQDEIMAAWNAGLINKNTASELAEKVSSSKDFRSPLRDPIIAELHKKIGSVIQGDDSLGRSANGVNGAAAQNQFLEAMINFEKQVPPPDDLQKLQFGRKYQAELIATYAHEASEEAKEIPLNVDSALVLPPEKVDWTQQPIFSSAEELRKAVEDYNNSVPNGAFERLAAHLQVDPKVLLQTQARLLKTPKKK